MARPRKPGTDWRPARVYCAKGRYFLRTEQGREIWLAPESATREEVWKAFGALPRAQAEKPGAITLRQLLEKFEGSKQFRALAYETQLDARKAYKAACAQLVASGSAFGEADAKRITVVTLRGYMDQRGEQTEKRANAELSYLRIAFGWAVERGLAANNPCIGIKRFRLRPRTRYVTDAEFAERAQLAVELGRTDIQVAMELAYLCRLRENEILKMLDTDRYISAEGVIARRGKGSKTQIIMWSPRLQVAIRAARALPRRISTPCLITSSCTGRPLPIGTFRGAWQTLRKAAAERGQATDWTFHDLKAKGVSDFDGDKHRASGHKTLAMTEVYDRVIGSVESTR